MPGGGTGRSCRDGMKGFGRLSDLPRCTRTLGAPGVSFHAEHCQIPSVNARNPYEENEAKISAAGGWPLCPQVFRLAR